MKITLVYGQKMNKIMTKNIIMILAAGFVVTFIISTLAVRLWSKNFNLVEIEESLHATVDDCFVNTGYVYVWSGKDKFLIPPAITDKGFFLSSDISREDLLVKLEKDKHIYLIRRSDTTKFEIDY